MTALPHPTASRPPAQSLREHISRTLRLAGPVIVARCGILVMVSTDTIMTGHAGGQQLAYLAMAYSIQVAMLVLGVGLMGGAAILVSQADGAGNQKTCGNILWVAVANAFALGSVFGIVLLWSEDILLLFGQSPDLAAGGGEAMAMFAPGMPAVYMFTAGIMFLEGLSRPRPGMIVMLVAIVLNFGLNWLFIYDHMALVPGGAAGAVLATSLTRWFMVFALFIYILTMRDGDSFGVRRPVRDRWFLQKRFLRLGVPLALSYGFETTAFMSLTMMAGWLGASHVAGFQVTGNFIALVFMVAIGMSAATAVRVGNAVGRRDMPGMRTAGWVGTGLIAVIMIAIGVPTLAFPDVIARVYTSDADVLVVAIPALTLAAFLLVADGLQGVLIGALRGAGDIWPTTWIGLTAFWVLMVPTGYGLGIALDWKVQGLLIAELIGVGAASVLLAWRFHVISRRDIVPV